MIEWAGKISFRIHPTFWILPLLIAWGNSASLIDLLLWLVVIFLSLTVHEMGHAVTAYVFGQKPTITLYLLGGVTTREGSFLTRWKEFFITLNGPLAGICLAGSGWLLYRADLLTPGSLLQAFVHMLFLVNTIWTIVNVLPILPLDGGHLLSHMLEALFGVRGIQIAYFFGGFVGIAVGVAFFFMQAFLAGALFLLFGVENFRSWYGLRNLSCVDREPAFQEQYKQADKLWQEGDLMHAQELFLQLREKAKSGVLYTMASCSVAKMCFDQGKLQEAYSLLKPCLSSLEGEWIVLCHQLAAKERDWPVVVKLSREAYQQAPIEAVAVRNAFAFGSLKQAQAAVGWLQCAEKEGSFPISSVIRETVFDSIRTDPVFSRYAEKILSGDNQGNVEKS